MSGKRLTQILICLFVLAFACGTLMAQSGGLKAAPGVRSNIVVPFVERNSSKAAATIFTNLGPTTSNLYNAAAGGYYEAGPANSVGISEQWIALPFTPRQNSHAKQLMAAVGWISGTKKVFLGVYTDAGGVVGTLLGQASTAAIPTSGVCCLLTQVALPGAGVALTANTPYWLVATTDDTAAPDFTGVWQSSNNANTGGNVGLTGWFTFSNLWPAGAVKGTVP